MTQRRYWQATKMAGRTGGMHTNLEQSHHLQEITTNFQTM